MSFVNSLKQEDLAALRTAVKKIHFQHFDDKHGAYLVTNAMVDQTITR